MTLPAQPRSSDSDIDFEHVATMKELHEMTISEKEHKSPEVDATFKFTFPVPRPTMEHEVVLPPQPEKLSVFRDEGPRSSLRRPDVVNPGRTTLLHRSKSDSAVTPSLKPKIRVEHDENATLALTPARPSAASQRRLDIMAQLRALSAQRAELLDELQRLDHQGKNLLSQLAGCLTEPLWTRILDDVRATDVGPLRARDTACFVTEPTAKSCVDGEQTLLSQEHRLVPKPNPQLGRDRKQTVQLQDHRTVPERTPWFEKGCTKPVQLREHRSVLEPTPRPEKDCKPRVRHACTVEKQHGSVTPARMSACVLSVTPVWPANTPKEPHDRASHRKATKRSNAFPTTPLTRTGSVLVPVKFDAANPMMPNTPMVATAARPISLPKPTHAPTSTPSKTPQIPPNTTPGTPYRKTPARTPGFSRFYQAPQTVARKKWDF